ncbi:MAG: DUF2341 domain-containing protein, partial [Thermoplasmata archaeon]|nr:DUF2341 domain-containing protein [Thermoplasmata archaeon]
NDHLDSTSNDNDGEAEMEEVHMDATGKIDGADDFDGSNDYVDVGDPADGSLDFGVNQDFTITAWIKTLDESAGNTVVGKVWDWYSGTGGPGWAVVLNDYKVRTIFYISDTSEADLTEIKGTTENWVDGEWHHIAVVVDRDGSATLYLDGNNDGGGDISAVSGDLSGSFPLLIGINYNKGGNKDKAFDGSIDEVRISDTTRSADWLKTSYNNQNSPSTFMSFENEQQQSSTNWQYRKKITIDNTKVQGSFDLSNFPVLINLASDSGLESHAQDDGDDILFTSSDATTKLDHEIEKFDGSTGELQAWVRIPTLSHDTDTVIYMYYGKSDASNQENPTGVWDSNYKMVQHLNETAKTTGDNNDHLDSTSNNNDGEAEMEVAHMDATGKIDGADDFDGTDDHVEISSFDPPHQGTVSLWVKRGSIGARQRILGGHDLYEILFTSGNQISNQLFAAGTGGLYGSTITSTTDWYYLAFTYDDTSHASAIFINGNSDASGSTADDDPGGPFTLEIAHRTGKAGEYFDGLIDEVRISNTARSDDW